MKGLTACDLYFFSVLTWLVRLPDFGKKKPITLTYNSVPCFLMWPFGGKPDSVLGGFGYIRV